MQAENVSTGRVETQQPRLGLLIVFCGWFLLTRSDTQIQGFLTACSRLRADESSRFDSAVRILSLAIS